MLLATGCILLGLSTAAAADGTKDHCDKHFVASWSASPSNIASQTLQNQTIRMIVAPHLGGDTVQVGFSNRFGRSPVLVQEARIATVSSRPAIDPSTDTRLTFGGQPTLKLAPGQDATSDPVSFPVEPFQEIAISAYVPQRTGSLTQHSSAMQTSYMTPQGAGNQTGSVTGAPFRRPTPSWLLVNQLDVSAKGYVGSVVALGDSITDGSMSGHNQNERYPDFLAQRLDGNGIPLTTVNAGIAGNSISVTGGPTDPTGPSALDRLDSDVIDQPGARAVIVEEGLNKLIDLGPDAVIRGLQEAINRLQDAGLTVVVATLTPARGTNALGDPDVVDAYRRQVNDWIRNQDMAPVADFDQALEAPNNPGYIAPQYSSPDHLHPNGAGYQALADAVPLGAIGASICPEPPTSDLSGPAHQRLCDAGGTVADAVSDLCGTASQRAYR